MHQAMLTTFDNPFDPFEDFAEWFAYDLRLGYNSCGLLARVMVYSEELSLPDKLLAIESAIDEITRLNASGMHRKVVREVPDEELAA